MNRSMAHTFRVRASPAHRYRRARERGAALVEMVVVVPVFVVLFAGMLFLHVVIAQTQKCQLAARSQAWTKAMAGCQGGAQVIQPDFTSRMDSAPGSDVSLTATPDEATGTSDSYASVAVLGPGPEAISESAAGPSFFQSIHSKAIVMCNTTTQPGNIPGVFHWFANPDDFKYAFQGGP